MVRVPIDEQDKSLPYYKYYEMDQVPLSDEQKRVLSNCARRMEDGLPVSERASFLSTTRLPVESGFYPLKDGGVLVASNIKMPDVTGDMLFWWTAWHCTGTKLRYAIWDPEDHYDVHCDEAALQRLHDPAVPLQEKTWGTTQIVTESTVPGAPADTIIMHVQNPADVGYDVSLIGTDVCRYISCALADMNGIPVFVTAILAVGEDGIPEFRERFWIGYALEDGEIRSMVDPDLEMPDLSAMWTALIGHNFKEYNQLNKILPSLYAEQQGLL